MSIENWSEHVLLVSLPNGLEIIDELGTVAEMVRDRGDCDVIIDFSGVDTITSSVTAGLVKLRELLIECGHRLVLCNVSRLIKSIFTVTGFNHAFVFVDDTHVALENL